MTASERPLTERQEAILLAMLKHERQADAVAASYGMTANDIGGALGLPAVQGGRGAGGRGSGHRTFGPAQRVIRSLNGLGTRKLVEGARRRDGRSGSAYALTEAGMERAVKLKEARG